MSPRLLQHYFTGFFFFLTLYCVPNQLLGQESQTVRVTVTDGNLIRCSTDNEVIIELTPNSTKTLVDMRLFWQEGADAITILPGESFILSNTYDLTQDLANCDYDCQIENGFCRTITVVANYEGGESAKENNSLILTFKKPPEPDFDFSTLSPCINTPVDLTNNTCPSNANEITYVWSFPGGGTSTDEDTEFSFPSAGRFQVTLRANSTICPSDEITKSIQVISPAEPVVFPIEADITVQRLDTFIICGQGNYSARLIGSESTGATSYDWSSSNSGVSFNDGVDISGNDDTTLVSFSQPGLYEVTLEVDNNCRQPMQKSVFFRAVESQALSLQNEPDACSALEYTPTPFIPEATYTINGNVITDFPVSLTTSPNPYLIKAQLQNACSDDPQVRRDTFFIQEPEPVDILVPSSDTVVCLNTDTINLSASIPGGSWRINGSAIGNSFFPNDFAVNTYTLEYTVGESGCEVSSQVNIELLDGPQLDIGDDLSICENEPVFTIQANEAGGIWEGVGITDEQMGTFDPSLVDGSQSTITYTLSDATFGCVASRSKTINIVALPELTISDTLSICNSSSLIELSNIISTTVQPIGGDFSWRGDGVVNEDTGSFDATAAGGPGGTQVFVEYSIPPGCSVNDTIQIEISELVEARSISDTTACNSQEAIQLSASPEGGIWVNESNQELTNPIDPSTFSPGTFTLSYIINRGTTCESSSTTLLTIVDGNGVSAGDDIYVCETADELNLPSRSGIWSGEVPVNNNIVEFGLLEIGAYNFTLTDNSLPEACNTDQLSVFIEPLPDIDFTPDTLNCVGLPVSMNNSSNGDIFNWDFGDNTTADNDFNPSHEYQEAGTFPVTLSVQTINPITNQELCQTQLTKAIQVFEPPSFVGFSADIEEGCSPLTVNFTNQSVGERLIFDWNFGNGMDTTIIDPMNIEFLAQNQDTTYEVSLTVANGCGNDMEANLQINVFAMPRAIFATEIRSEYCSGEEVMIGHRSFGDSLFWDFGNGNTFVGLEPPTQQYFTSLDYDSVTLSLVAKNQCGSDTTTQNLTIIPTDARALISVLDNRPCIGDTVFLRNLSRPIEAPIEWNFPDGSRSSGLETFYIFKELGQQSISATVFSCGEISTSLDFDVKAPPELNLLAPAQTCPDTEFEINITSSELNNTIFVDGVEISNANRLALELDSVGLFVITANAVSPEGCTTTAERQIDVISNPIADFRMIDSICASAPFRLESIAIGASSCAWFTSENVFLNGCEPEYSFSNQGMQSVRLVTRNQIGCVDSIEKIIFVRPTPIADFELELLEPCTPARVSLTDLSENNNGVRWILPTGEEGVLPNFTTQINNAGNYVVQLIASNDGICFDSITKSTNILESPTIELIKTPACTQEEGVQLEVLSNPPAIISVQGSNYSNTGSLQPNLQPDDYFITAETLNGCINDTITSIPRVDELMVEIPEDSIFILLGESASFQVLINQVDVDLDWTSVSFLDLSDPLQPIATPNTSTDFILTATNALGCSVSDTVFVGVEIDYERGVYIPNAFTPDNSGVNDVFRVRSTNPALEQLDVFRVFDQNGNIVFENQDCDPNDINCAWNGNFKGEEARAAVYIYQIVLRYSDGTTIRREENITLIR
ncbi:MAG: PKD domain-containing protein [Bacteroidota bacterium]